jgi:hypothetical protein
MRRSLDEQEEIYRAESQRLLEDVEGMLQSSGYNIQQLMILAEAMQMSGSHRAKIIQFRAISPAESF